MAPKHGYTRNFAHDEQGRILIESICKYCGWTVVESPPALRESELAHRLTCSDKVIQFEGEHKNSVPQRRKGGK